MVAIAAVVGRFGGPVADLAGAVGTAAHEAGGRVLGITVFTEGGGVTFSEASRSDWRTFLVAAAGYPATLAAALVLLTGALLGRSSRPIAVAGSVAAAFTLVFWTPFNSVVTGIDDGDQRFTWFVVAGAAALLAGAAALPDRFDGARRAVLGALAVGLLTDAFRATEDLVVIEDVAGGTATDADALAEASGLFGAGAWAWLMRLALFAVAAAWAWFGLRRWAAAAPTDATGS
jgi:hypothetical protein